MTSDDICAAIRKRFPAPEYATLFEVRDATGFSGTGSCDALVMGLWPSRGLTLHGIEIKISRSDWLREMKAPAKAETFARYCDHWSVVVPADVEIVQPMELPPTWGLARVNGRGLQWSKEASKLEAAPIDRKMLAALLRAAENENGMQRRIDAAVRTERERIEAQTDKRVAAQVEQRTRDRNRAEKTLREFEEASGVDVENYRAGEIGRAVKLVLQTGDAYWFDQARVMRDRLTELLDDRVVEGL